MTLLSLLAGCGGGGGGTAPPPAAPDLAGAWAGTWQGSDPTVAGTVVTGTWEAVMNQGTSATTGNATLFGDVDCMEGTVQGSADANNQLSGTYSRPPCNLNQWLLTALDLTQNTASGTWTQSGSGARGTFSGTRIATLAGPRVLSLNPQFGAPGTILTIAGTGFSSIGPQNMLTLNTTSVPSLLTSSPTVLVARVPGGATTGRVSVQTPTGKAASAQPYTTEASFPEPSRTSAAVNVGLQPSGVAISRDGRKAYVANRGNNSVTMIDAVKNQVLVTRSYAPATPDAIAVSLDGRRVYVTGGTSGILVLDSALITQVDTITVNTGGGTQVNPQGLAVSPDGKRLYVSQNTLGGTVSVVDLATKAVTRTFAVAPTAVPLGIAASPDDQRVYVAVSDGATGSLKVCDALSLDCPTSIAVGSVPVGITATPDGNKVYVSNQGTNTVSVYQTAAQAVTATIAVGAAPAGIAVSPDGSRVYAANSGGSTVSVILASIDQVTATATVGTGPVGVGMSADGTFAFVANATANSAIEIGGPFTLTVAKTGAGIGTVTSSPPGIECGPACQAKFAPNLVVTLSAAPGRDSAFASWGGDPDCSDGTVTMNANKTCTAVFNSLSPPPTGLTIRGFCFIATAAYGSDMASEVIALRRFRDSYLLTNAPGRAFVRFYYAHSPVVADFIAQRNDLRAATRLVLWPVVYAVVHPHAAIVVMIFLVGGFGGFGITRRLRRCGAMCPDGRTASGASALPNRFLL